jgi:glycosyltransferase involved in cell wall biosynthesis
VDLITHKNNSHVSDARNTGLMFAKGRYVLPLDADDRLAPDALKHMVKALEDREVDLVGGKLRICHEKDRNSFIEGGWPNDTDPEKQLSGENRMPTASMVRRQALLNVGGWRRRIRNGTEDADMWTRLMSYGYRPHMLPQTTLLYTHREDSLGKTEHKNDYLKWYPWTTNPRLLPAGAWWQRRLVDSFATVRFSIIMPVGPGHEVYLQTAVDSVINQSVSDWELIVVNDTGKSWREGGINALWGQGLPAKVIELPGLSGPAKARNAGVRAAKGKFLVFLDADDVAQPAMLASLHHAYELAEGGWIYGDWYSGNGSYHEAPNWDMTTFLAHQLSPITGLYPTEYVRGVGGFDEDAPGWEDWELQMKLVANGICGTRVRYPLITYHLNTGMVREGHLTNKETVIQYLRDKHEHLITEGSRMPCSSCGGKRTQNAPQSVTVQAASSNEVSMADKILVKWNSRKTGSERYRSSVTNRTYKVTPNIVFPAFAEDQPFFEAMAEFEIIKGGMPAQTRVPDPIKPDPVTPPLQPATAFAEMVNEVAAETHVPDDSLFEDLEVPDFTMSIDELDLPAADKLKAAGITTVEQLIMMSDEKLLVIKGIGTGTVKKIRQAIADHDAS